jgi:hypothetical protein
VEDRIATVQSRPPGLGTTLETGPIQRNCRHLLAFGSDFQRHPKLMSHLCSPSGQEVTFLPLCLSASFLNMVPSKAVRTYPDIDSFIFQHDVFCPIRLHTPDLRIIWRGVSEVAFPHPNKPVCSLFARVLYLSIDKTVLNEAGNGAGSRIVNGGADRSSR